MTLILALGIRRGMVPFVIALCFAGWGEIMQFVRGEVMAIKPKPFIESAIAVGLRTPRLFLTQVVPNLLSSLISLTALEMGAVLMVLGELGFIGIFIGGGAFAELDVGGALYHYSDVPEWGSLLSGVRAYARSYPWVAVYPALAFFIAILGFNLFGEGLRRMIESVGVGLNRLLNRYTLAAVVVGFVVIGWARSNTGSMAFYKQQARAFDGQQAYAQVAALADPALEDRSLGSQGMEAAADAIARHFQDLGLQPAGQELTYFQNRNRSFETLDAVPQVSVDDGGPPLEYIQDYVEYAGPVRSLGQAQGPVRVILARAVDRGSYQKPYPAIQEVVEPEDVLMALTEQEGRHLTEVPHAGLLVVAEDPADLRRHATLSDRSAEASGFGSSLDRSQDGPNLYISEALANRILAPTGETVASLRKITQGLPDNQVAYVETQTPVSLQVEGTIQERVPVRHVIGHLPGVSGRASAGEAQLDNQLIVVLAQYDSPPYGPDGCCPATNDNASGVGVMLEVVRAMREANYQPYRTFLFVAYAGEGLDGGEVVEPQDVNRFLQAKAGFATAYDVEAIIDLRGVGAGTGNGLELSAGGNQRLAELFESSARRVGLATSRAAEPVDLSVVFADRSNFSGGGQEAPYIRLSWEGWQDTARTAGDTLDTISPARLQQVGQALAQALMIMGREDRY
jgi:hypothetical protein